jgi:hypothetical protein
MTDPAVPAAPPAPPPSATLHDAGTVLLPSLAMQLASLYATREPLKQSLAILDAEITRIETQTHQAMAAQDVRTYVTTHGALTLKPKTSYVPTDWDALYDHVATTREFDLLHKRLSITALNERAPEAMPPGVIRTQFDEFKFTPAKGK